MVGFTQYSPSVLALLIDREEFFPLVVHNASELSLKKINAFLENSDSRLKVIMFESMDILSEVLNDYDLNDTKVVVLDTILNLSRADLEIRDVQKRPDNSYQFFTITPLDFNKALRECEQGMPEGGIKNIPVNDEGVRMRATIIRKNMSGKSTVKGEVSDIVNDIVSHLGNREKILAVEGMMQYIVGIANKRKLSSICDKYDISKMKIIPLEDFVKSNKGKALKLAFMDAYVYGTDNDVAIDENKASKLDFDFLVSVLPLDKEFEFLVDIPKTLIRKRKSKVMRERKEKLKALSSEDYSGDSAT